LVAAYVKSKYIEFIITLHNSCAGVDGDDELSKIWTGVGYVSTGFGYVSDISYETSNNCNQKM